MSISTRYSNNPNVRTIVSAQETELRRRNAARVWSNLLRIENIDATIVALNAARVARFETLLTNLARRDSQPNASALSVECELCDKRAVLVRKLGGTKTHVCEDCAREIDH